MQFGIWTPLPHTIRPEPEMDRAVALLKAGEHGAGVPALAEALKLSPAQVRDLLGDADQRPVLRLVGGQE